MVVALLRYGSQVHKPQNQPVQWSFKVRKLAQTGLQFDLRSAQGKLIASLMAALAEFERDLLRERVRSCIAATQKRDVVFGRRAYREAKCFSYGYTDEKKLLRLASGIAWGFLRLSLLISALWLCGYLIFDRHSLSGSTA